MDSAELPTTESFFEPDGAAAIESNWSTFRRKMPVVEKWAYFDHAAVAPLCGPASLAIQAWVDDVAANGDACWSRWRSRVEEVRRAGAALLNAEADEIALIRNTTEGLNLVAEGFPWKPGDNVVVPAGEFPSNRYPWLNLKDRGVETRIVASKDDQVDLQEIERACNERTRLISASWVGYSTGWRIDVPELAEIAHRRGALFCLDAIQGLGVFPLDVRECGVDFLAADGHKWLLAPEGAGLFFVRGECLDLLRPIGVGWNSVDHSADFSTAEFRIKHSAARYEGGSYNMAGVAGLGASLEMFLDYGIQSISNRLLEISDRLCHRLTECGVEIASCRDSARRSGIVSFTMKAKSPQEFQNVCRANGVIVNCRSGRVRVSPHCYTSEDDIDRLVQAVSRSEK